ncbi:MAG: DUF4142 domain-containing protein [Gemmatimonadota bacterium]
MKALVRCAALAALLACGGNGDDDAADTPAARDTAATARKAVFTEPDALGVLFAFGDAEIALARTAREVSQSDAVISYANVIIADHQGIKTLFNAPARNNLLADSIRTAADSIARALLTLPAGFNNTYIEEQIKINQHALQLLDTAIIPSARAAETRSLLEQLRPTIAAHLQRALQILSARRQQAAERGEPWISGFQQVVREVVATPAETPAQTEPQPQPAEPEPQLQPQPQPIPIPLPPVDTTVPPTTTSNM